MVRHGLKHIFQKPTPDIDSSDRTQQLRSKTVYAATVDLAKNLAMGNNSRYKTYNGPYEVVNREGNSTLIASHSYQDLLSITKGKVLLNQLPLNHLTQAYYQKNFASGQMYQGNYNQFNPEINFSGLTGCNDSVLVYDISNNGFTGPSSYDLNGGFIGATGPQNQESVSYSGYVGTMVASGSEQNNRRIFIDPNHCYYSDPCLLDASYTRFVSPGLTGTTGPSQFNAQQIISADQYRGFSYPMSNFNLTCKQQLLNQKTGPIFCPPIYELNTLTTTFPPNMYTIKYLTSQELEKSSPQVDGFTVYQFGTSGTVPIDATVTHAITYKGVGPLDIYYAVVGGGGGGGSSFFYGDDQPTFASSSGGGGGGFFSSTFPSSSPVQLLSGVSYPVIIGGGGSAGSIAGQPGQNGQDSVVNFNSGSSTGYGGGGGATAFTTSGGNIGNGSNGNNTQGNGGGGAGSPFGGGTGGTGTFAGGNGTASSYAGGGGGGGMTQIGGGVSGQVSKGGDGISNTITGVTQYFGAGGGGGAAFLSEPISNGIGGLGGGGNGGWWYTADNTFVQAQNGANVYGSGGGGASSVLPPVSPYPRSSVSGANGGSGSVWVRFKSYALLN